MTDIKVMETSYIQRSLFRACQDHGHKFMVSNRYLENWFEADFISVTKADYLVEYEIKRSRADFLKEQEEKQVKLSWLSGKRQGVLLTENKQIVDTFRSDPYQVPIVKQERWDMKTYLGPNRFWYTCPEGLLEPSDMPSWAGLLWIGNKGNNSKRGPVYVKKDAEILHRTKITDAQKIDILTRIQYAYWKLAYETI